MANSNTNNDMQYTTPVGTAKFPYLVKPDTKFDDRGTFKVDLIITSKEAAVIKAAATELAKSFMKEDLESNTTRKKWGLHLPLLDDIDQDGEDTGLSRLLVFVQGMGERLRRVSYSLILKGIGSLVSILTVVPRCR